MMVEQLKRTITFTDAVFVGLGSMLGAGIFVALPPAAAAAGGWLVLAFLIAAVVAYANAMSTAWLAARYPESGGAYVYGRAQLGELWGYLAGFAFTVGKLASCAAMALAVGIYAWPEHRHAVAVVVIAIVTVINYLGVQRSTLAVRVLVILTLVVLVAVVLTTISADNPSGPSWVPSGGVSGTLEAAGLLFFAFAGYARIATLGEEVADPVRTIPRAIPVALGIALLIYVLVALAVASALGIGGLAAATDPLAEAVESAGWPSLAVAVRVGAVVAATSALLALLLGVSRTVFAMARDGYLPAQLAVVHPRFKVPGRIELIVGVIVMAIAARVEVADAIGFSAFLVLAYYLIANISSGKLHNWAGSRSVIAGVGAVGCVVLGVTLPWVSVLAGALLLLVGALTYTVTEAIKDLRAHRATTDR